MARGRQISVSPCLSERWASNVQGVAMHNCGSRRPSGSCCPSQVHTAKFYDNTGSPSVATFPTATDTGTCLSPDAITVPVATAKSRSALVASTSCRSLREQTDSIFLGMD